MTPEERLSGELAKLRKELEAAEALVVTIIAKMSADLDEIARLLKTRTHD